MSRIGIVESFGLQPGSPGEHTPPSWAVSALSPVMVVQRCSATDPDLVRNLATVHIAGGEPLWSTRGRQAIADARLIAAAPSLLAATTAVLGWMREVRELRRDSQVDDNPTLDAHIDWFVRVIADARGAP